MSKGAIKALVLIAVFFVTIGITGALTNQDNEDLTVFACVVDPEAIVIGGGVSRAGQPLIDCIETYYKKYAFSACKETPIILAKLGNDAGIYGSARMVI